MPIQSYRKKPVEIQALQWTGDNMEEMIAFGEGKCAVKPLGQTVLIATLEGTMIASKGDYVIRGVQGEFYPCKPDIFQQTYTRVPELTQEAEKDWLATRGLKEPLARLSYNEIFTLKKDTEESIKQYGNWEYPKTILLLLDEVLEYRAMMEDDLK